MNTEKIKPALFMLLLIGVLTFLFIKTQEHDVKKNHDVILTIQQLSHHDALLNESILKLRSDRYSNYDSINQQNKSIKTYLGWLKSDNFGLYGELGADMDQAIDDTTTHFTNKEALVEKFKSHNGILKNSMHYLPNAIKRSQRANNDEATHKITDHLLREILQFNTWPNDQNKSTASVYIEALDNTNKQDLLEISNHAKTILEYRQNITSIIDTLFQLPTTESVDTIYQIYSNHNSNVIRSTSRYRTAMYGMALIMIFYLLQLFITLRRTMHNLEESLCEVEFQKGALDEHAIVASVDPSGTLNYVNDKFVKVSGFEKEEVVGQSWSILGIDTVSAASFDDMWSTLSSGNCWKGEIQNKKKKGQYYWVDATIVPFIDKLNNPVRYVALLTDITERKQNEERIFNLAHYDGLTNLPNRAYFLEMLEKYMHETIQSNSKLAVLFLDLDNFKMINDTMGHASGDELLQIVSDHLRSSVRQIDSVSRLGGDEFTITLRNIQSVSEIEDVIDQIMSITQMSIPLDGGNIEISTSVGVSVYPDDASDRSTLLKNADIAMYKAKSDGKNTYRFYSEDLKMENTERHSIENELRLAIKNQEFELYYQPRVIAESGEISSVEALIRWHHPEKGLILPDDFIPALEDSGLIIEVGKWIIFKACAQLVEWQRAGFNIRMIINISAHQIRDRYLFDLIKQLLAVHPIKPSDIELELTESSFLNNPDYSISIFTALSELGIRLALDDFGSGYSSLSHLKKLPIDTLKIDRSFIMDLPNNENDLAIATAVIAIAKNMNLKVIAEGVETAEQFSFLSECGCDGLQGYYISKPLPAEALLSVLQENKTMFSDNNAVRVAR